MSPQGEGTRKGVPGAMSLNFILDREGKDCPHAEDGGEDDEHGTSRRIDHSVLVQFLHSHHRKREETKRQNDYNEAHVRALLCVSQYATADASPAATRIAARYKAVAPNGNPCSTTRPNMSRAKTPVYRIDTSSKKPFMWSFIMTSTNRSRSSAPATG